MVYRRLLLILIVALTLTLPVSSASAASAEDGQPGGLTASLSALWQPVHDMWDSVSRWAFPSAVAQGVAIPSASSGRSLDREIDKRGVDIDPDGQPLASGPMKDDRGVDIDPDG